MSATSTPTESLEMRPDLQPAGGGRARLIMVRILAGIFLLSLVIPLLGTWFHWDPVDASNENRRLTAMPTPPHTYKEANHYTDQWLDYYRDHFGMRNALIRIAALGQYHGIGEEMSGDVVVGKEGWLYFRADGDRDFIGSRGLNPMTSSELDAWQKLLETRQKFLAARGIPYLVVVPPDKQTIYPEYLPYEYRPVLPVSRLDQLIQRLKDTHSPVRIVDLRPALLAAKSKWLLYRKTDTHWNDLGAFVGYQVIIHAIQDTLPKWHIVPQTLDDFTVGPEGPEIGDLARMMDMPSLYPAKGRALFRKIPFPIPPAMADRERIAVMDLHDPTKPRLVIYRDSFSIALVPMLGPHFGRVAYAFIYPMERTVIAQEKPDLVITEFIERNLYIPPPVDPQGGPDFVSH
jgi:alginate O-acetyltransferase complex protein AlgJ